MKLEIFPDAAAVAKAAASFVAAEARAAVAARGRFTLALSGGKTPWMMLDALAEEDVPWGGVHVAQVDERIAPDGDPDRNLTHMQVSPLGRLCAGRIDAMPVSAPNLEAAAREYQDTLGRIAGSPPVLDLVHLGLGSDGHTASLIPGDPALDRLDADVALTGVYQGRRRMTLTFPAINRCRRVLWLVAGAEKAAMVRRLLEGDVSIPAGSIRQDAAVLLVDRAAAARLDP